MNEEIWRPIEGYEGLYEVSSYGRIRSVDRYVKGKGESYWLRKGRVLSLVKSNIGYLQVSLCCNGKYKTINVHRLVAQVFIPNPDNLPQINHKDEDKTNNRVDNLEWCAPKYNMNYGSRQERYRNTMLERGHWSGLSNEEYHRKWYQENKEKILMQKKEYYLKKKEQIQNNV